MSRGYRPGGNRDIILTSSFMNAPPERIKIPIINRAILGFQYFEIDDYKGLLAKAISFTIAIFKMVNGLTKDGWSEVCTFHRRILLTK
jgi:hypothetical protein